MNTFLFFIRGLLRPPVKQCATWASHDVGRSLLKTPGAWSMLNDGVDPQETLLEASNLRVLVLGAGPLYALPLRTPASPRFVGECAFLNEPPLYLVDADEPFLNGPHEPESFASHTFNP